MLRNLNGTAIALLIIASTTFSFGEDSGTVHATTAVSSLFSESTTYFTGDTKAFNAAIEKLASGFIGTVDDNGKVIPNPNITVFIYKGTGKSYLKDSITREAKENESIVFYVPPVPRELSDGQLDAFNFDWIVTSSATNSGHREVVVALFVDGEVDLFDCAIPENVSLKVGKPLVVTTPAYPESSGR